MSLNPYLKEIQVNLPRILSLFDTDLTSQSYGLGDRFHWAWGLIDFGNGSFQGAANGLARLWVSGLWPYKTSSSSFLKRINAIFKAAHRLTRRDGSLEEAFPHEGSYCVTALVAYDLLVALDLLTHEISTSQAKQWEDTVKPMISFLISSDETHAMISNHLSTAVAALARWHRRTDDAFAEQKAKELLTRILSDQSNEGWFCEYEGADPGYQSLSTYYLADVHQCRPDWQLHDHLRQSIQFLQYFAHPDGSFGGLYGSRCTRFYYPAGVYALASDIPEASSLADFMERSISENRTVTLSSMDEPNLIPMFNAYAWAAVQRSKSPIIASNLIPSLSSKSFRKWFPDAGFLIDNGAKHYSIISTHKGGVVYHYCATRGKAFVDAGLVVRNARGRLGSTQSYNKQNTLIHSQDGLEIFSKVTEMPKRLPSPVQFLIIRLLCCTVFRSITIREWVKRSLVSLLITRKHYWRITNNRKINLGPNLVIKDTFKDEFGYFREPQVGPFVSIHMASQGYWQIQDEAN